MNLRVWIFSLCLVRVASGMSVVDPGQGVYDFTGVGPGLSGITWMGGDSYLAVSDSVGSPDVYPVSIRLNADGTIVSASLGGAMALAAGDDNEGISFHPGRGTLFVSDEGDHPDGGFVREFNRTTGALVNTLAIPDVMKRDRSSLGFEALTSGAGAVWICNEQALEHESQTASSSQGSLIRLQKFNDTTLAAAGQWAYLTDPEHGAPDLVALPDGRLLVLERAFSYGSSNTHHNRIYLVDFSNATDTSAIDDLDTGGFVATSKTLLWDQDMGTASTHNFEGIALGPSLGVGAYSLILIADNNTGSSQHLYPLRLVGVPEPGIGAWIVGGVVWVVGKRRRSRGRSETFA